MKDALATWHMGRVIYAYRTHPHHDKALTQELVAGWLGLTQAQLSRMEHGGVPEEISKLVRWAQALGIPDDLLWFKLPAATTGALGPHHTDITLPADNARDLPNWITGHKREPRTFPIVEFDEAQHVAAALGNARRHFDGPVVEFFGQQLHRCKADDGALGPATALPLVVGILGAIQEHARDVRPTVRRQLLAVAADGAEFAGWLYRDLHDPKAAAFWYDRAMEWAQEAGNLAMQGYVLIKKSQMAYDARDAARVVTLAQAAGQGPWQLPARVQAEALQQEALALAMIGEPIGTVERRLGQAHDVLATATAKEEHPLGAYFTHDTLVLRSACCLMEAGKPDRAVPLFRDVIDGGGLSRRDAGFFGARQAVALALSGEPDEAANAALASVAVAKTTCSERTMNVVKEVVRALEPWRNRPSAQALRAAVTV